MVPRADVMISAFHGRKNHCFLIETELRPNRDQSIFAKKMLPEK